MDTVMRTIERNPIIILSLSSPSVHTAAVLSQLLGRAVTCVEGVYHGQPENSVIVQVQEWTEHEAELVKLLNSHDQNCVLFTDGQRNAWLCHAPLFNISQGAEREFIGEMQSRPVRQMTKRPDSYTIVGDLLFYVR